MRGSDGIFADHKCCNFQCSGVTMRSVWVAARISSGQSEHPVDELILTPHIGSAHPSNLPLAQHVDRFITLNWTKPLRGMPVG